MINFLNCRIYFISPINDLKNSLDVLETINQDTNYEFQWKKDKIKSKSCEGSVVSDECKV